MNRNEMFNEINRRRALEAAAWRRLMHVLDNDHQYDDLKAAQDEFRKLEEDRRILELVYGALFCDAHESEAQKTARRRKIFLAA